MNEENPKLEAFLKAHNPEAPAAPRDEKERLLTRIAEIQPARRPWLPWLSVPVAAAAGLALWLSIHQTQPVGEEDLAWGQWDAWEQSTETDPLEAWLALADGPLEP